MRDEKGPFSKIFTPGTVECAIACAIIGVLTALLLLWAGFWKTLLVVALVAVGAFIGGVRDKKEFFAKLFGSFRRDQ